MNLITNLVSALLFPQMFSVLSSESIFFASKNLKENSMGEEFGVVRENSKGLVDWH